MPILGTMRDVVGTVVLSTLPGAVDGLWDYRSESDADDSLEPVQVVENQEYRFEFVFGDGPLTITTDRPEVFLRDHESGLSGRFRPALYTGTMPVRVQTSDGRMGAFRVEVRSRKLDYVRDYRWMMRDIASLAADLILEHFAPSEQRFSPDPNEDSKSLYQQFAFLKSVLEDESFDAAIHRILSQPYISWASEQRERPPGQGWSGGSSASLLLSRPGRRIGAPGLAGPLAQFGVPERLAVSVTEPTIDNLPNRYVKFALQRWRGLAARVAEALRDAHSDAADRGRSDAAALLNRLDALLAEELFLEVGELDQVPSNNQVVQKREGYRDISRAFVLCEVAARLSWSGGDEVYGAGQKNIAVLYEYWVFLQLASAVAEVCRGDFDWTPLLRERDDEMGVELERGKASCLKGSVTRLGRTLSVELWFNKTFGRRTAANARSWSRPMRPDCSILISANSGSEKIDPVWLHFDAKYRIEGLASIFDPDAQTVEQELNQVDDFKTAESHGRVKSDDLAKMHTYRDAIRRSAGAYVIYPGHQKELTSEFHELLPGLGAFALKPSQDGLATGSAAISGFIHKVIDHLALQTTQHERDRFWSKESFTGHPTSNSRPQAAGFLAKPPADVRVLLGFVRGEEHLAWVHETRRYNLRADARTGGLSLSSAEVGSDLLLLYSPDLGRTELWTINGAPELATRDRMLELGYPNPRGSLYFCLSLERDLTAEWIALPSIASLLSIREKVAPGVAWGAPVALSWLELVS